MMRAGFSGSLRNATMLAVMRRIGRTRRTCSVEIDQRGGDGGNDQRQDEDADGKIHHRLAQRRLVQHDLDELAALGGGPHDPHDIAVRASQRVEGIDDGAVPGHVAHVDVLVDRWRHVRHREQAPLLAHFHGDRARADALQDLLGGGFRDHPARRGVEHQRRGIGVGEPVAEPVQAVVGDRRNIDQHLRDHHEQQRENEKLARQSHPRAHPARFVRGAGLIGHVHVDPCAPAQPKRRSKPMRRRTQLRVRLGLK